jgi:hypothetical protein
MRRLILLAALAALVVTPRRAPAQEAQAKPTFEVYGFAEADLIQDFNRVRPDWNATLRPSRIPTIDGLYGSNGETIFSARQSRLGVKASVPFAGDVLKTKFEFDFFGSSDTDRPDAGGQNGVRFRQAYGEWGPWLAGLTHSLFMDADLWPNIIDYWGPAGMAFYRNVQLRYTWTRGDSTIAVALERPITDLDPGTVVVNPAYNVVAGVAKLPDVTAQYRLNGGWGWLQVAGIVRWLGYDSPGNTGGDPKGNTLGFGADVSSVFKAGPKASIRLSAIGGKGISYYMNDCGGPDLAFGGTTADPTPEAVPTYGLFAYVDYTWNEKWTSSAGYSGSYVQPTALQGGGAFKSGHYASINVLTTPMPAWLLGPELLWGKRIDKDGASGTDLRVQFTMKWSFSSKDAWK